MSALLIVTFITISALFPVAASSATFRDVLQAAISQKRDTKLRSFADVLATNELKAVDLSAVSATTATGYVSYNIYSDNSCGNLFAVQNFYASGQCIPYKTTGSAIINFDPSQTVSGTALFYITTFTTTGCAGTGTLLTGTVSQLIGTYSGTCSTSQGLLINGVTYGSGKIVFSATNTASFGAPSVIDTQYAGTSCSNPSYVVGYSGATGNCAANSVGSAAVQQACAAGVCASSLNLFSGSSCSGTPSALTGPFSKVLNTCNRYDNDLLGPQAEYAVYNTPSSSSSSSSSSCFSGSSEVIMESGTIKQISEVVVGDRLLSYSTKTKATVFSDVVAIPHARNSKVAQFIQITTESGKKVKMTAEHLIQSCEGLVAVSKMVRGSCVITVNGQEKVSDVEKVVDEGLYTIVTSEDLIVVNGVVASPFAMNHVIPNMFYNIHRILFNMMPSILSTKMMASVSTVADEIAQYYTVADSN